MASADVAHKLDGYGEADSLLPSFQQLKVKLFTREDPIHLHKILGLLSVLSFIYRYSTSSPGNLGFNGSLFDWVTIGIHLALSTSSLIFHVLAHRILNRPMVIWEEYRLHAIVFSLRCASLYVFATCFTFSPSEYTKQAFCQYLVIMAHHLVVDKITEIHSRGPQETTVRVVGDQPLWKRLVLRGYSFYQFLALGSHLIPHQRTADLGFNALIAIQSSAFLMTCYRKGLIQERTHAAIYSFCLILSGYHIVASFPNLWFFVPLFAAFFLRVNFSINKYLLWALFSFSICYIPSTSYRSLVLDHVEGLPTLAELSASVPSYMSRFKVM